MDHYANQAGDFINQFLRDVGKVSWMGESQTYGYIAIVIFGLIFLGIIVSYLPIFKKYKKTG
jgi:preprotein translocase subunit SecE